MFADQQGSHASLREYVITRIRRIDSIAIELWGRLGWLDYEIANGWYVLLYVLVMLNVACVCWRPRRPLAFAAFAGTVFVAFAMTTMAGEFGYLPQAGYTLQGRYFLPAVVGLLAPVLSHRVTPARYALLAGLLSSTSCSHSGRSRDTTRMSGPASARRCRSRDAFPGAFPDVRSSQHAARNFRPPSVVTWGVITYIATQHMTWLALARDRRPA